MPGEKGGPPGWRCRLPRLMAQGPGGKPALGQGCPVALQAMVKDVAARLAAVNSLLDTGEGDVVGRVRFPSQEWGGEARRE